MSVVQLHVYDVSGAGDDAVPYVATVNSIGRNMLGIGGVFHGGVVSDLHWTRSMQCARACVAGVTGPAAVPATLAGGLRQGVVVRVRPLRHGRLLL